jgi:L-rhamnose mutarotase
MISKSGAVRRFGQVIGVRPKDREEYIKYHAAVWPEVLRTIHECNIRNYSIFMRENTLFAYFEYVGDNFSADMSRMAADPKTQEWWAIMKPMQVPLPDRKQGDWWTNLEEVFHVD